MTKTNGIEKMTSRAALFDACVADMTPEKQADIAKLVKWVCVNMLRQENAEMSAKELIVQALRFEEIVKSPINS
jgi:hypothetical protein